MSNDLVKFEAELMEAQDMWVPVLPETINKDRFKSVVISAINRKPALLRVDRQSLLNACSQAAQDGLLPDGREGVITIFYDSGSKKQLAQWMPMVTGILKRCREKGELTSISAYCVYKQDTFDVVLGTEPKIVHKPDFFTKRTDDVMNIVLLSGTLDGAPKLEETISGAPYAVLYLTSAYLTSRHEGRTTRHRVTVWGDRAREVMDLKEGDVVFVVGQIRTRYWRDKNGRERYMAEVLVSTSDSIIAKALHTPASPCAEQAGRRAEGAQHSDVTNDLLSKSTNIANGEDRGAGTFGKSVSFQKCEG